MASMPDVNKTELSVRVSNETYVAINKIAAGSGVGRATLVRRWLKSRLATRCGISRCPT